MSNQHAPQRLELDYERGGGCDPKRLNALPADKAPAERDRCAQARGDQRIKAIELDLAARANSLSEWNVRVAAQQARIGFVQTIATVAAFIAAAVAALFAWRATHWTREAAQIAARSFNSAERPWLVLSEFQLTEPMTINSDHFTLSGRFKVKNVGRAVALNAFFNAMVVTERMGSLEPVRLTQEEEARRTLATLREHNGGLVIAPGDELDGVFGANLRAHHLEGSSLPHDPGLYPFAVCTVTYRSPNDHLPHQTSFTLHIRRKSRGNGLLARDPILLTGGVIPIADLEIVRFETGYTAT